MKFLNDEKCQIIITILFIITNIACFISAISNSINGDKLQASIYDCQFGINTCIYLLLMNIWWKEDK